MMLMMTMQMMYKVVAKALQDAGLSKSYHPRDYLIFYRLGNQETNDENEPINCIYRKQSTGEC